MPDISLRDLLDAGVHFGHQTRRWNPRMKPYIFGSKNGIHIINLQQTAIQLARACAFVTEAVATGEKILFVGTKRQASDIVAESAAGMRLLNVALSRATQRLTVIAGEPLPRPLEEAAAAIGA